MFLIKSFEFLAVIFVCAFCALILMGGFLFVRYWFSKFYSISVYPKIHGIYAYTKPKRIDENYISDVQRLTENGISMIFTTCNFTCDDYKIDKDKLVQCVINAFILFTRSVYSGSIIYTTATPYVTTNGIIASAIFAYFNHADIYDEMTIKGPEELAVKESFQFLHDFHKKYNMYDDILYAKDINDFDE